MSAIDILHSWFPVTVIYSEALYYSNGYIQLLSASLLLINVWTMNKEFPDSVDIFSRQLSPLLVMEKREGKHAVLPEAFHNTIKSYQQSHWSRIDEKSSNGSHFFFSQLIISWIAASKLQLLIQRRKELINFHPLMHYVTCCYMVHPLQGLEHR